MLHRWVMLLILSVVTPVAAYHLNPIQISGTDRDLSKVVTYYSDFSDSKNYTQDELDNEAKNLKNRLINSRYFLTLDTYFVTKNQEATLNIEVTEAFPYMVGKQMGVRNWEGKGTDVFVSWDREIGLIAAQRGVWIPQGWGILSARTKPSMQRDVEIGAAWGIRSGFLSLGGEVGEKWRSTYTY